MKTEAQAAPETPRAWSIAQKIDYFHSNIISVTLCLSSRDIETEWGRTQNKLQKRIFGTRRKRINKNDELHVSYNKHGVRNKYGTYIWIFGEKPPPPPFWDLSVGDNNTKVTANGNSSYRWK
jgi:hypothetical protein